MTCQCRGNEGWAKKGSKASEMVCERWETLRIGDKNLWNAFASSPYDKCEYGRNVTLKRLDKQTGRGGVLEKERTVSEAEEGSVEPAETFCITNLRSVTGWGRYTTDEFKKWGEQ